MSDDGSRRAVRTGPRTHAGWPAIAFLMLIASGIIFLLSPELAPQARKLRERIESRTGMRFPETVPAKHQSEESVARPAVAEPKQSPKERGPVAKAPAPAKKTVAQPPPPPPEPPLPRRYIPYQRMETARMFNGMQLEANVRTEQGAAASKERGMDPSYRVALDVRVNVPTPVDTAAGLARLNPDLLNLMPGLPPMVEKGKVSDFFHGLYERKIALLHEQVAQLDQMVSRHNFYDCETILELKHATSHRRALLIQGEMDVVADGSDGDRSTDAGQTHVNFQPFTSYRWKKRTEKPNPFLADRSRRLSEALKEFEIRGLSIERNRQLRATIDQMRREILELEKYSFLVAALDPFIVVPGFTLRYPEKEYAPRIGDLAVVIHGARAYPALVGDAGPSYKCGEASLRIAQTIDPRCDPYRRPVSDLSITYIVFPRTAMEPAGPPDLPKLRQRCIELLGELGGFGGEVHEWVPIPAGPTVVASVPQSGSNACPPSAGATNAVDAPTVSPATNEPPAGGTNSSAPK